MATIFLVIIYLAFISLGLPDSLLGVAWAQMRIELNEPLEAAGIIYMVIAGGTIISSFASGLMLRVLGTGKITSISTVMTAGALLGFSFAPSLIWFIVLAIPLGLGAGAIDAAINSYVAAHYKAHHMSWLHCFWGLGATIGPIIMSSYISGESSWRNGFIIIALIQFCFALVLFAAMPLWNKVAKSTDSFQESPSKSELAIDKTSSDPKVNPLKIRGAKLTLLIFTCYCGVEATMGLWGSSFLINAKNFSPAQAAKWVSLYYAGITVGRFLSGFLTLKMNNKNMIRMGLGILLIGIILLVLPLPNIFVLPGCILVGLGCAPIYPCMIHETPARFGKEASQAIIGYQMAFAYMGSTFLPPTLGFIATHTTIAVMPFFMLVYTIIMFLSAERFNLIAVPNKH